MKDPAVTILLDGNGRTYYPGDRLAGQYRLASIEPEQVKAIEISVLWYTEGKGDEEPDQVARQGEQDATYPASSRRAHGSNCDHERDQDHGVLLGRKSQPRRQARPKPTVEGYGVQGGEDPHHEQGIGECRAREQDVKGG